ncbi:MAG: hypothetical protein Q9169_006860 [Polycauliona sp. 2 TL-2023]
MGIWTDAFVEISERWHLHGLVVDPEYQRRGVGGRLLSWGLEQAKLEKVPTTLTASTVAEPLYRRLGFETYNLMDLPGVRIGVPGLILWPPGKEEERARSRKECKSATQQIPLV